eukprot:3284874-Prymnesium_polylepis.1
MRGGGSSQRRKHQTTRGEFAADKWGVRGRRRGSLFAHKTTECWSDVGKWSDRVTCEHNTSIDDAKISMVGNVSCLCSVL